MPPPDLHKNRSTTLLMLELRQGNRSSFRRIPQRHMGRLTPQGKQTLSARLSMASDTGLALDALPPKALSARTLNGAPIAFKQSASPFLRLSCGLTRRAHACRVPRAAASEACGALPSEPTKPTRHACENIHHQRRPAHPAQEQDPGRDWLRLARPRPCAQPQGQRPQGHHRLVLEIQVA